MKTETIFSYIAVKYERLNSFMNSLVHFGLIFTSWIINKSGSFILK